MRQSEEGQVIVEYILMITLVVSISLILTFGFRKSIFGLWVHLARDVAGACPQRDCTKDTSTIR